GLMLCSLLNLSSVLGLYGCVSIPSTASDCRNEMPLPFSSIKMRSIPFPLGPALPRIRGRSFGSSKDSPYSNFRSRFTLLIKFGKVSQSSQQSSSIAFFRISPEPFTLVEKTPHTEQAVGSGSRVFLSNAFSVNAVSRERRMNWNFGSGLSAGHIRSEEHTSEL